MALEDVSFTKRMLLFAALSLPVVVGWNLVFPPPLPAPEEVIAEGGAAEDGAPEETGADASKTKGERPAVPALPQAFERRDGRLVGDKLALDVTNLGGGLISGIDLLDAQFLDAEGDPDDVFLLGDKRTLELSFVGRDNEVHIDDLPLHVTTLDAQSMAVRQGNDQVDVTQTLTLTQGYEATYVVTVTNRSATPQDHRLNLTTRLGSTEEESRYDLHRTLCLQGEELEARDTAALSGGGGCGPFGGSDIEPGVAERVTAPTDWTGVSTNFFAQIAVPDGFRGSACEALMDEDKVQASVFVGPETTLAPGGTRTYEFGLFLGPKFEEDLLAFEAAEGPSLHRAIDWGWFGSLTEVLGGWMLRLLRWFYSLTGIWGLSIILLTFVVRIAMIPLTLKQLNSMKAMKKIQPELTAIKEKYKDDKLKQSQEMQAAMSRAGANPMAGCFPLLLQFPVFIALYASLQAAVELYHVPFLWMPDLTAQDPTYLLPLAMGGMMYLQAKLQPTPADNEQAKMMQTLMPVIFTVMMLFLPAGLTVYIFASTVIGVLQTLLIVRPNSKSDEPEPNAA